MTDIRKLEAFLYDEAALLDNPDLDAWMELFTEDGTWEGKGIGKATGHAEIRKLQSVRLHQCFLEVP